MENRMMYNTDIKTEKLTEECPHVDDCFVGSGKCSQCENFVKKHSTNHLCGWVVCSKKDKMQQLIDLTEESIYVDGEWWEDYIDRPIKETVNSVDLLAVFRDELFTELNETLDMECVDQDDVEFMNTKIEIIEKLMEK